MLSLTFVWETRAQGPHHERLGVHKSPSRLDFTCSNKASTNRNRTNMDLIRLHHGPGKSPCDFDCLYASCKTDTQYYSRCPIRTTSAYEVEGRHAWSILDGKLGVASTMKAGELVVLTV